MRRTMLLVLVLATPAAATKQWPEFRGPTGQGEATGDVPVKWSEQKNVVWKTPIHDRGWSSPVVLGDQIWMTTATKDGHEMYGVCVDRESGEIRFDKQLFYNEEPRPLGVELNSYASPTPVIEPGRVYLHFGSYGTACLDTKTFEVLWERRDLRCDHFRGPASSPVLFEDKLILTMDGADRQYLVALDKRTGETVWRTPRTTDFNDLNAQGEPKREGDLRKGYSTPRIYRMDGEPRLFSPGAKAAFAYDPRTGEELWKVTYPTHSPATKPLFTKGMLLFSSGFPQGRLLAVRPGGSGDVTDTHVVWRHRTNVPKKPSPVVAGDLLFMVSDGGIGTCLEVSTGKEVWRARIGGRKYSASPIRVDDRVYFFSHGGRATVIRAAREYKEVAVNRLDSGFMASPAVAGDALYLRTKTHLYHIEERN